MKQAVILAAGEGQRLRPFTVTKPKVMIAIAGKPILQHIVQALAENGIREVIIVVGYRREQIYNYLGAGEQLGVNITYITQERQLGTAHALLQTKNIVQDDFMVLPGDNLIAPETIARFTKAKPPAVLIKKVEDTSRYGVVTTVDGVVKGIIEKPREPPTKTINTGIYVFSREIFDLVDNELHIPDVLNYMLENGRTIGAQETDGPWLDVVYPWDILSLNAAVLRRGEARLAGTLETGASVRGTVSVGRGTVVRSNSYLVGPVVIGENCDIGPNVCILPSTSIGNNVVVSSFTEIKNSVIGDDVSVGPGCLIENSVIDNGCVIKGHFTACSDQVDIRINNEYHRVNVGAMLGASCSLGNCVVAQPGVIVGNYTQVQAMKLIGGRVPDKSLVV